MITYLITKIGAEYLLFVRHQSETLIAAEVGTIGDGYDEKGGSAREGKPPQGFTSQFREDPPQPMPELRKPRANRLLRIRQPTKSGSAMLLLWHGWFLHSKELFPARQDLSKKRAASSATTS